MKKGEKKPTRLTDFKGKSPRVGITKHPKDEADVAATKVFMDLYTQDDGFHCPRCEVVITDGDKAVAHLAEEMNKALVHLGKLPKH